MQDIDALKARIDLAAVIRQRVDLKRRGRDLWGRCPFHNDHTPSFNVSDEYQRYRCFSCGEQGDIIDWLAHFENLTVAESIRRLEELAGVAPASKPPAPEQKAPPAKEERRALTHVCDYEYRDEEGVLAYVKRRLIDQKGKKTFAFMQPGPKGLVTGQGESRLLYRLPDLRKAIEEGRTIYLCEGEKAVDAAWDKGLAATCHSEGATGIKDANLKWRPDYDLQLRGCKALVVVADRDAVGERHAELVAKHLARTIPSVSVRQSATQGDKDDLFDHLEQGYGVDDLIPRPDLEPKRRFPLYTLDDMERLPGKAWILENLIGEQDLVVLAGPPGQGKTFLVVDLLLSCVHADAAAMGGNFWLRRDPVPVVYAAGEKFNGMRDRMAASVLKRDLARYPGARDRIGVLPDVPQLFREDAETSVDVFLDEMLTQFPNGLPGVLAIDTLHRASVGAEENSATDMGVVIHSLKRITSVLGCAIILVHHTNKVGGVRGSSALEGAADCVLQVMAADADEGAKKVVQASKISDAPDGWRYGYDLVEVVIDDHRSSAAVQWRGLPYETAGSVADEVKRILREAGDALTLATVYGRNTLPKDPTRKQFLTALERLAATGQVDRRLVDPERPESSKNPPMYRWRTQPVYNPWDETD